METFLYYLADGLANGAVFAVIALGYTLVYGIIKLINFAHGEFLTVGAYAGFLLYLATPLRHASPWIAIPVLTLVAGLAGSAVAIVTERVAYKPIRQSDRLAALLTAIGVSFLLQNLFKFINRGNNLSFPSDSRMAAVFEHASFSIKTAKFVFIGIAVVMMLILWYLVMHTRFGRAMRATSQDLETARLMGIDVDHIIMLTFALGGFLAGVTGILLGAIYQINPMMGFMPGLIAFIAAVVGGIGSIPGAVVGGLLIGLLQNMVIWAGVPSEYRNVAAFVLLILVLVWRPQGILGRAEAEKV